ncbi:hypothetical protein [Photobacterium leiognathi]|uniref:hypothetical protein n=1 Tax=Photobacterium leiognathi TaxID=553611 RepID=UPI0029829A1A|nr:hypothetical protein [Photobacterium leiognathi]
MNLPTIDLHYPFLLFHTDLVHETAGLIKNHFEKKKPSKLDDIFLKVLIDSRINCTVNYEIALLSVIMLAPLIMKCDVDPSVHNAHKHSDLEFWFGDETTAYDAAMLYYRFFSESYEKHIINDMLAINELSTQTELYDYLYARLDLKRFE